MPVKRIFWDSRLHVGFTLFLVWLMAFGHFRTTNSLIYPLLAVTAVTILDLSTTWIRDHKIYLPVASPVTGLLIGLIIDPREPFLILAVASLLASFSKQFINGGLRQHIFNPAAFGIMTTSLIFGTPVAWWGVTWSKWPLIILIPLMIRILWRIKKIILPITFFVVYFIYLAAEFGPDEPQRVLINGSVVLFALVMLPEPITSPSKGYFKYLFGTTVALISILLSKSGVSLEPFLLALLLGNLLGFVLLRFKILAEIKGSRA